MILCDMLHNRQNALILNFELKIRCDAGVQQWTESRAAGNDDGFIGKLADMFEVRIKGGPTADDKTRIRDEWVFLLGVDMRFAARQVLVCIFQHLAFVIIKPKTGEKKMGVFVKFSE